MKLTLYFPESFPVDAWKGRSKEIDPVSHPSGTIFILGRHPESHIQVRHREISGSHCAFRFTPPTGPNDAGQWELADWGSVNGTYFKNRKLEPRNWEPFQPQDKFYPVHPGFSIVFIEEDDTLQTLEETEILPLESPKPSQTAVIQTATAPPPAPSRPYTWSDAAYEVVRYVTGAQTPGGTAFRVSMVALAVAIVIVSIELAR